MKRLTVIWLVLMALVGPSVAQEPLPFAHELEKLKHLQLSEAQVQQFMGLLFRQAPRLMDESADPAALAREIMPEAFQILDPQQLEFVRGLRLDDRVDDLRMMTREQRRQLIKEGVKTLENYQLQEALPAEE